MDTELKLLHWRDGQVKAERLCSNILMLEGFSSVDPQCPLGGPDGIKDVICEKNGWKYVAAAYFPTSQKTFSDIKSKFKGDLVGVSKNNADGIVFLTNQKVSPTERDELIGIGTNNNTRPILYHRERLRSVLDNPLGFAHRLEYLGIEMSKEEQLSFFSQWNNIFAEKLQEQSEYIIQSINQKMENLIGRSSEMVEDIGSMLISTMSNAVLLPPKQHSSKSQFAVPTGSQTSAGLTASMLCAFHGAICFGHTNTTETGEFRTSDVWIGGPHSDRSSARFTPPAAADVPVLVEDLLKEWRSNYQTLSNSTDKTEIIDAITDFHHRFVSIHPFVDGNGRMARYLLMLQASELLDVEHWITLEDKRVYFEALQEADNGNFDALRRVISQAIFGIEDL